MHTDKQLVFNQITDHLARQKVAAKARESCMLRTGTGLKCAVGCLIPDSEYLPDFEESSSITGGGGTSGLFGDWLRANVDKSLYPMLSDIQDIHDDSAHLEVEWPASLDHLAWQEGLTFDREDFTRKLCDPEYNLKTEPVCK